VREGGAISIPKPSLRAKYSLLYHRTGRNGERDAVEHRPKMLKKKITGKTNRAPLRKIVCEPRQAGQVERQPSISSGGEHGLPRGKTLKKASEGKHCWKGGLTKKGNLHGSPQRVATSRRRSGEKSIARKTTLLYGANIGGGSGETSIKPCTNLSPLRTRDLGRTLSRGRGNEKTLLQGRGKIGTTYSNWIAKNFLSGR